MTVDIYDLAVVDFIFRLAKLTVVIKSHEHSKFPIFVERVAFTASTADDRILWVSRTGASLFCQTQIVFLLMFHVILYQLIC